MSQNTIETKSFYFDRIEIRLVYDAHFDIFTIDIVDTLPKPPQILSPFGFFTNKAVALQKFNSIKL